MVAKERDEMSKIINELRRQLRRAEQRLSEAEQDVACYRRLILDNESEAKEVKTACDKQEKVGS